MIRLVTHMVRQLPFPYKAAVEKAKKVAANNKTGHKDLPLTPTPPTTRMVSPFNRKLVTVLMDSRMSNRRIVLRKPTFLIRTQVTTSKASTHVTGLPSLSLNLRAGCRCRPKQIFPSSRTEKMEVELADDTIVVTSTDLVIASALQFADYKNIQQTKFFATSAASNIFIAVRIIFLAVTGPTLDTPALTLLENRTTSNVNTFTNRVVSGPSNRTFKLLSLNSTLIFKKRSKVGRLKWKLVPLVTTSKKKTTEVINRTVLGPLKTRNLRNTGRQQWPISHPAILKQRKNNDTYNSPISKR